MHDDRTARMLVMFVLDGKVTQKKNQVTGRSKFEQSYVCGDLKEGFLTFYLHVFYSILYFIVFHILQYFIFYTLLSCPTEFSVFSSLHEKI
jgi:hypothetical protein